LISIVVVIVLSAFVVFYFVLESSFLGSLSAPEKADILMVFMVIMLIAASTGFFLVRKLTVDPILHLREEIKNLDFNDLTVQPLSYEGENEISDLTREINRMLLKIEAANKDLINGKRQLQLVIEGANIGFWDYDIAKKSLLINSKSGEMAKLTTGERQMTVKEFLQRIHPNEVERILKTARDCIQNGQELDNLEFRLQVLPGEYKWIMVRGSIVERDESGQPLRMTGISVDINKRKSAENELRRLNYYDILTGLYNRGYFEYVLAQKRANNDFPFAIIVCDINGLKIINDTFGHTFGDQIILAAAEVLRKSCRKKDVVCRWGGDEFAIILNNADNEIAEEICARIKVGCAVKQMEPGALSMAVGYSIATPTKDIRITISEAEERMYRHKLFEDQSPRSSLLTSLQRTLEEKSHETQEHTWRLRELCAKMGKRLHMDRAGIDELMLFAMMHDIGKIGIPDEILNKPGELTEEEWELMKTHTVIGYRIASASPQLRHIAYPILTHHEHYDGGGYPKGLKGTRIPRISRILSIVDAFDVMTYGRPYKEPVSESQAIEELKRCSGTQFDPELVKLFIEILENSEQAVC